MFDIKEYEQNLQKKLITIREEQKDSDQDYIQIGNAWEPSKEGAVAFFTEASVFGIENLGGFHYDNKINKNYWWFNV